MSILRHVAFGVALYITSASLAHAVTLSVDPAVGRFGPGDTFVLTLRLDTSPEECVNAVSVEMNYPTDWMKASAVSKGESLLTLWTVEPVIDIPGGVIRFEGGIPAGYCGRVQGDPGKTNVLAKIIFTIPGNMIGGKTATGQESLSVTFGSGTKVLLNDGFGTQAPLTLESGAFIRELSSIGINNEWLDAVHEDATPPELFKIDLARDATVFQGKYFIIFSTVDKQSGVSHYEVSEDDPLQFGYVRGKKYEKALFVEARSPHMLADQSLGSRVIVRAFDHAGNISEAILSPQSAAQGLPVPTQKSWWSISALWYALGGICVVAVSAWVYIRRYGKQKDSSEYGGITDA